ncbi:MAG: hypothetical protein B6229_02200 [Spirochaetaceae bacterium 4572_7]|nr:MAG: hypothetical protein B6229_02200 [Spirochaetaceae bacterium 4572_7]
MRTKIKNISSASRILLSLFFSFFLFISCSEEVEVENNENKSYELIRNNWLCSYENEIADSNVWQEIGKLSPDKKLKSHKYIYFKYDLPNINYESPALFIGSTPRSFLLYYNDSLIYPKDKKLSLSSKYKTWHIISISKNNSKKNKLVFKTELIDSKSYEPMGSMIYNSMDRIYKTIYKNDFHKVFSALFLVIVSIIAIIVSIYVKRVMQFIEINLFVFFLGFFLFANTNLAFMNINSPELLYYLDMPLLFTVSVLIFFFLRKLADKKYKKYISLILIAQISLAVVLILLDLMNIVYLIDNLLLFLMLLLSSIAIIGVIIFKKGFMIDKHYKIFVIGLSIYSIFASLEIVFYIFSINYTAMGFNMASLYLGAFALVFSWIVLYLFKYIAVYENYIRARDIFSRKILESQNEERKRIAQNLHDATGHDLLIIKNLAQFSIGRIDDKPEISNNLLRIAETSDEAVGRIRTICNSLYPPVLENLGLTKAIKSLIQKTFMNSDVEYELILEDIDSFFIKSDYIHIYRVFQEIINNIHKHSKATKVRISVKEAKEFIIFTVTDNGVGIKDEIISHIGLSDRGFGLSSIIERIKIFKGKLNFKNIKPNGLEIQIKLPKRAPKIKRKEE